MAITTSVLTLPRYLKYRMAYYEFTHSRRNYYYINLDVRCNFVSDGRIISVLTPCRFLSVDDYEVHPRIISLGYRVSDSAGNLRARKLNKAQSKIANITGVQYFITYQQGVVSSNSSFIIYHLSSLYLPHNFAPNFPFKPMSLPPIDYNAPLAWAGLIFFTTMSPPSRQ